MFKKEHLNLEGLERIRKIKGSINKTLVGVKDRSGNKGTINCTSEALYFLPIDIKSSNNICTANLITILSSRSIYNEVYKLMGGLRPANLYFLRYMSVEDKQALINKSKTKLEEIRESLINWTYLSDAKRLTHIYKKNYNIGYYKVFLYLTLR